MALKADRGHSAAPPITAMLSRLLIAHPSAIASNGNFRSVVVASLMRNLQRGKSARVSPGSLGRILIVLNHAHSPMQRLENRRPKDDAGSTTATQRLAARLAVVDQIEVRPSGEYARPVVLAAEVM